MRKLFLIALIIGVVVVAYWLISPLFINKQVHEETVQNNPSQVVSAGTFSGLAGHSAQGAAKLIKTGSRYYIRFEDDFRVTNGPDLYVYLGKNGQYDSAARLGALKGNVGSQNYEVPDNLAVTNYSEVWVWCRSFSVAFGKAELK